MRSGGPGKQCEAALTAAALFTKLSKLQYGASVDFSKCYDLMRPEGAARLLTAGGWPQGITNLLLSVWTSQLRWICWESHTGEVPLGAGTCVPQGCPFGPLALALWMTAGHNAVTAQDNQLFTRIYMDDRTFIARNPVSLVQHVQSWHDWSQAVGLSENTAKTQFTASTSQARSRLAALVPAPATVQADFEVLGCCAQVTRRQNSKTEDKRLLAARRTLLLIGNLRWPFERFLKAAHSHAISKCLYGWLARTPTQKDSWKIWADIRRAQRVHQWANRFLRAILYGGNGNLDCLSGTNLLRIVAKMMLVGQTTWSDRRCTGTPLCSLDHWFSNHGNASDAPYVWKSEHEKFTVNLNRMTVCEARHAARMGWRWYMWQRFLQSGRHECPEVHELCVDRFANFDFTKIRTEAATRPAYRALVTGAMLSPACLQN